MSSSPLSVDSAAAAGDLSWAVVACAVIMTVVGSLAVGLRFYTRGKLIRAIRREDWCILVALVFSIISTGFVVKESQAALGHHLAVVTADGIMAYLHASYFMALFYNLSLCFTKISILFLYLRVLTYDYVRKATYVALAIVITYNFWAFCMYLTMCIPIAKMWDRSLDGYCHPVSVWWALTYLHIITDFVIFLIPMPVILTMTIPTRQKVGLSLVFATGLFVCLVSVLRTLWLKDLLYSTDFTWDLVSIANWSSAEINIAIVCACLTTLKPLLAKLFGPMMTRFFPDRPHPQGNGLDSSRPMTIGSMPLNKVNKLRQQNQTHASTAFAPDGTLADADTSRDDINLKDHLGLEAGPSRDAQATAIRASAEEVPAPPMARVKD
ncbi:Phosphoglucosamine mutase [Diplogelasinospora grovesii]|uniref:Phosphoglucosamine mutase n=1 Tax=Diplogelasinospora grovesii TaxID=303347 RepID=A0AAN6N0C4_9PEZI|nr:Phosphoglucosamine mutase [Diplogelasinospora grovesii]